MPTAKKPASKSATPTRKAAPKKAAPARKTTSRTTTAKPVARKTTTKKTVAKPAARKSVVRKSVAQPKAQAVVPAQSVAPQQEQVVIPAPPPPGPMQVRFGQRGEIRSPGKVLLLTWITLGIYGVYTHYKLNAEMADYSTAVKVDPVVAVVALFVPIAGIISVINTATRVRATQAASGIQPDCSGGISFLCMFVGANGMYQQSKLNMVWQRPAS